MHVVTMVLTFLVAVVVSTFVARLLPLKVPLPLLQISIGAGLSWFGFGFGVEFDSHLFLLLFIPPLLFLDGWRIPKGAFFSDWKPILALAIGLVVVSGVLAAAVAGIAMHYGELSGRPMAATRMQRDSVWDTVQIALSGIIFVLLGEQLPGMVRNLPEVAAAAGVGSAWHLLGYAVAITLALGALRFAWVWIAIRLTVFRAAMRGDRKSMPQTRLLAVAATAGVRGAITLAGILTLPLVMPDGSAFPARDVAIFLAMGVILLALLIANTALPLLTRGLAADLPHAARPSTEGNARIAAAEAAIRRIEAITAEPLADTDAAAVRAEAAAHLLDIYRRRLHYGDPSGESVADMQRLADEERRLRVEALRAERDELYRLRLSRGIDDAAHRQLVREIDLMEASLLRAATL